MRTYGLRELYFRYRAFRRLGFIPAASAQCARESLEWMPRSTTFAVHIVELEERLKLWGRGLSYQEIKEERGDFLP